mmetsp:Transcript_74903/g.178807  ORF Transcript_74903/g.178807 Transcript_74903/m.178807 type:complete len:227 (-) Transcript_74903:70-750(-)|eukprot:CAMPEP_0181453912 /NCGR_PEP_ID=MMETSP1110-20121109/29967_1 /TAXON_ID=174948 /ORGANISM="Symbiodinium sp., Strain CCMP421" /LENGTH=226 /DNA_ID=CAMNT_0023578241 /DNA_START=50 /DNA_END=730 /DNA_ORIENTATION=-
MAPRPLLTSLLVATLFSLAARSALRFTPGLTSPSRSVSATAAEAARKKKVEVAVDLDSPPKRPLSSYMRFAVDTRPEVVKKMKGATPTEVVSEIANRWRKLTAAKKKPYVLAAEADFAEWREKKQAFVEAGGVLPPPKRRTKDGKVKLSKDPLRPKQPGSAYVLWVKDNYAAIKKKNPTLEPKKLIAVAGKEWSSKVTKATKTKYEKKRAELMKEYAKAMEVYNSS